MSVKDKILELQHIFHSEPNENKLMEKGSDLLDSLRQYWRSQKEEFTESDIQLLQRISSAFDAVEEFTETVETFPYLVDKEDVDETIGSLYSIVQKIEGFAFTARVQKEIRELLEKRVHLPSRESRNRDLNRSRAIHKLDVKNRKCKKCGAGMVVREGKNGYFWGCSTFPICWETTRLTQKEINIIFDGEGKNA
ncbi:MAG TPA: hypothetical protein ENK84_11610 [Desulfobulbus sp.]|nr:hypothetical protein [Desulfobulbus sp.]